MNLFWKEDNVWLVGEQKLAKRNCLCDISGKIWIYYIENNDRFEVGDEFFEDPLPAKKYCEAQAYILISTHIDFLKTLLEDLDGGC